MTMPPDAQMSEDGNYWWDAANNQWQLVDQSAQGGAASSSSSGGQSTGAEEPMDWSQYPEIARVLQYGSDIDTYLQDLGVDPSLITEDDSPSIA